MPNTKKQYAGGKRPGKTKLPGKTKRFFKALATGSTKTKVSVNNAASKKNKLHASEQKLKGIESQVRRTQKAANTHATTKKKLETVETEIKRLESINIPGGLKSSNRYYDLKRERAKLRQEFKKSKAAYYEHEKLKTLRGKAEIKVNKRKKTLKAYEKAAEKLTLQKFNKKRWVTGWDKKYKKASVADIHKFINVDSKLDSFKTISDSEGKPVKKLLKQFEFDDFMKHPARATEVINSFPGVKEYSAKIGINIDGLHENQKAMLAHKMIEITKNPDMTERAMATEMVKSVVVTKFASPEIKVGLMGYAKAPEGLGNPAPGYNPGESSTDSIRHASKQNKYPKETIGPTQDTNPEPEYIIPDPNKPPEPLYAVPKYGTVSYNTIRRNAEGPHSPEYLEPAPINPGNRTLKNVMATNQNTLGKAKQDPNVVIKELNASQSQEPIYNTASAGPASKEPIYNNPANLQALANQSARANPERTGTIKLKAGPNTATPKEGIYANMNTAAEPIYNNPK